MADSRQLRGFLRAGLLALALILASTAQAESVDVDLVSVEDIRLANAQVSVNVDLVIVNPAETGMTIETAVFVLRLYADEEKRIAIRLKDLDIDPGTRTQLGMAIPLRTHPDIDADVLALLTRGASEEVWPRELQMQIGGLEGRPQPPSRELQMP